MRAFSSTALPATYCGSAPESTERGTLSVGGAWYSLKPRLPIRAGSVATSTGPAALNTYTPGVTVNRPTVARTVCELPAVIGCAENEGPRSGMVIVIGHARLSARVTILSALGGSNGSR